MVFRRCSRSKSSRNGFEASICIALRGQDLAFRLRWRGSDSCRLEATDTASLRRYKERLLDIEEDLEESIAFDCEDKIERLEEEKDSILKHLSEVSGTGGRSRLKGQKEKARLSVLRAFQRMFASLPIGRAHIETRLKTGYTCTYTPESGEVWKVNFQKSV